MSAKSGLKPFLYGAISVLALSIGTPSGAFASDVTWEDILHGADNSKDVIEYGFSPTDQRFSKLSQINSKNVDKLEPVWSFSFGDEKQRGQESQALVHDGVIYVTASYSRMFALDAKTGKKIWSYTARLPDDIRPCCDVVNRGPALYGDKVFMPVLASRANMRE